MSFEAPFPPQGPQGPQWSQWSQPGPPVAPAPEPGGIDQPPRRRGSARPLLTFLAVLGAIALIADAFVVTRGGTGSSEMVSSGRVEASADPPDAASPPLSGTGDAEIIGGEADSSAILGEAISLIEEYWAVQMPDIFGIDYVPVSGGLYSASSDEPLPPCVDTPDQIVGNAFYCGDADVVAWDDEGLIPDLIEGFGPLSVAVVLAHEWGHAVQARVEMTGQTVTLENQADCYAGAWVADVEGKSATFGTDGDALDRALAGFLAIADTPGTASTDPNAHGSGFDRVNAFQDGFENASSTCADYSDETVTLVQLPFFSREDLVSGGNAPYSDILTWTVDDLEDYWKAVSEAVGAQWRPLNDPVPFDPRSDDVRCGDESTEGYSLFYCQAGHYVGFDNFELFPSIYDVIGDFAVSVMYSNQYGFPAQEVLGLETDSDKEASLLSDCLTGSWASSVFLGDRPETGSLSLSPGDLDEALQALLSFGDGDDEDVSGTGFERVLSFRTGVLGGVAACTGQ